MLRSKTGPEQQYDINGRFLKAGGKFGFKMKSEQLRKHHIQSFSKLNLFGRLSWAFAQNKFLSQFMNSQARSINKNMRRNGKKYFRAANLA